MSKKVITVALALTIALGGYSLYVDEANALWWLAFLAIKY